MPRDGLTFAGYLPPASVPPDPIDEDWRGPPGPPGPPGTSPDLASPPPIGNTTPNTGAFTTFDAAVSASSRRFINATPALVFSGSTVPSSVLSLNQSYSGTYTGTGTARAGFFQITADNADLSSQSGAFAAFQFLHNFGGTSMKGSRAGVNIQLTQTAAINDTVTSQNHVGLEVWATGTANAGGTAGFPRGELFPTNFQASLTRPASYWRSISGLGEVNLQVAASNQTITVGGAITNGNTCSVVFTAAGIAGSPVTVTTTVITGMSTQSLAATMVAAANHTPALRDAGISCATFGVAQVVVYSPLELALSLAVSTSGGATATLSLGAYNAGASVTNKAFLALYRLGFDSAGASRSSTYISMGSQGGAPWSGQFRCGIGFAGGPLPWSWRRDGTLVEVGTPQDYDGSPGDPNPPPYVRYGLDFYYANYVSGASFRSPTFTLPEDGTARLRNSIWSTSSAGASLDVAGLVATGIAVSAAGGGGAQNRYFPGDLFFFAEGGQGVVDVVNGTGGVTAVTMLLAPSIKSGSPPSNPVATLGGSGQGLTVNVTWPAAGTLTLQPSGGATTVGGDAVASPLITINGAATGTRALRFNSASVNRFAFMLDGTDNFLIRPYPNAGSGTNGDTTINRLTGGWTFGTTIGVAGLATALGYRATGATFNYSTATPAPITRFVSNYTGVYNGTGGSYAHIFETSDTADTTADSGGSMLMLLTHQFSGSKGGKGGLRSFLVQSAASDTGVPNPQHVSMEAWTQVAFNAGGTNLTDAMNGGAYAFNPQVLMLRGATNWFTANPVETNIGVEASTQPVTVGGTATAGNTATITFVSAGITGSPVAVTYTTGTGQSNSAIANGIVAAINSNAALRAAGVAAQRTTGAAVVNLYWPGELTVTPSVGMSGGSTTTLALGTFLAGASVVVKNMNTFIRLNQDSGTGASLSAFLVLTGQGSAPASGQFGAGLQIGTVDGAWSIAPNGAVIKIAAPQIAAGSQGRSIVFAPQTAQYALDVRYLNVTEAAGWIYRSPGLADRGNGVVEIKSAVLTANAAGFAVDVTGRVASSVAIAAGGGGGAGSSLGNYAKGDIVFDDYQGQHRVDAVNPATGAVTGITTLVSPHVASGSPPANPLATLGGSGVGLTLTATWPPDAALSLQPSGGKLGFFGAAPVAKPTAVPVTAAGVHAALVAYGLIS